MYVYIKEIRVALSYILYWLYFILEKRYLLPLIGHPSSNGITMIKPYRLEILLH